MLMYGRYSMNSRTMRLLKPGIVLINWSSVRVFRLSLVAAGAAVASGAVLVVAVASGAALVAAVAAGAAPLAAVGAGDVALVAAVAAGAAPVATVGAGWVLAGVVAPQAASAPAASTA